MMAVMS